MTNRPWSWANVGLGNATPMASFYCAHEFELIVTNSMFKQKDDARPLGCIRIPETGI